MFGVLTRHESAQRTISGAKVDAARRLDRGTIFSVIAIVVISFICYLPSLNCGFVSDDFFQYAYFYNVLRDNPAVILQNLFSCWMDLFLRELHYRPFLLVPHLLDCFIWNFNPVGYHVTNILIHAATSALVFLSAKKLLAFPSSKNNVLMPFLAALLFATHPWHAEAVSWISGRVASYCTLLYVASFLAFLSFRESKRKLVYVLSLVLAFASMLSKEFGVTIPAVLMLFLVCDGISVSTARKTIIDAVKLTLPFWLLVPLYCVMRYLALGTLIGGYAGLSEKLLASTFWFRMTNWGAYEKIFLPVPMIMAQEMPWIAPVFAVLCLAIGGTTVVNCLQKDERATDAGSTSHEAPSNNKSGMLRLGVFLTGWMLINFATVAWVWNITPSLSGGRHFYLVAVPLAILVVLLAVPDFCKNSIAKATRLAAVVSICAFCALSTFVTIVQHRFWSDSTIYSERLRTEVVSLLELCPRADRLLVLNIPSTHENVCLYPSLVVFQGLFSKPFCKEDLSNKIASLLPIYYDNNRINKSAVAQALSEYPATVVACWHRDSQKLLPVHPNTVLPGAVQKSSAMLESVSKDTLLLRPERAMTRGAIDYVDIVASCKAREDLTYSNTAPSITLSWNDDHPRPVPPGGLVMDDTRYGAYLTTRYDLEDKVASALVKYLPADGITRTYRFHLSELTSWLLLGKDPGAYLTINAPGYQVEIKSATFANISAELPILSVDSKTWVRNLDGTFSPTNRWNSQLAFDASHMKDAAEVIAEYSQPDAYWEYFEHSFRQTQLSPRSLLHVPYRGQLRGRLVLPEQMFQKNGDYQVRVAARDKQGKVLGYVSDPVTIRIRQDKVILSR